MEQGHQTAPQPECPVEAGAKPLAWLAHARRAVRYGLLSLMLVSGALIVGFAFFADHVSRLAPPAASTRAEGIIVLTGGSQRIQAAIDLLEEGKGKRLLISGVNPQTSRDLLRKATGAESPLFNCCVDIDIAALDTIGNADEGAKWINRNHFASVILVTNNYHMPRSIMELKRKSSDVAIIAWPVVNTPLEDGSWMAKPEAVRVIFIEYVKYLAAVARGVGDIESPRQAVASR